MEGQDVARQALSFPEPFQNQHSAGGSPSKPCSKVDGTDGAAGAGGDDDDDGGYLSSEGEGIELRDDDGASSSDELEESGGAAPRPGAAAGPGEAQNPVGNMPLAAVVVHADSGIGAQAGSSRLDLPINPRRKVKASRHGREEGDWAAVGEIPEGSTPAFAFTGEESFPALQGPEGDPQLDAVRGAQASSPPPCLASQVGCQGQEDDSFLAASLDRAALLHDAASRDEGDERGGLVEDGLVLRKLGMHRT
mmetsp:Transcript_37031/g.87676  ORF Transcript_37031/g.87676 Transcript_37031/m.87676 type:complete len:250 (+) Transcript_37031:205-954(+)